jgi:glycosyltransferase involved in cell wall biosynthesis
MNEPRITVIIPAFNRAHLVGEAIQSVLDQDLAAHEIIVVDDGSTDDTAAVAARYPVRVISQENRGTGGARNRGIVESSGGLLAFLDSDDRWMPARLSTQVRRLEAEPRVDLVFSHYREVHDRGGVRRALPEPIAGWSASSLLARREVFDRVGLFETELTAGEFIGWCALARELGVPMAILPDVLVTRLIHGGNITRDRTATFGDYARVIKASLDRRRKSEK